jgi:hypothetical protein
MNYFYEFISGSLELSSPTSSSDYAQNKIRLDPSAKAKAY